MNMVVEKVFGESKEKYHSGEMRQVYRGGKVVPPKGC